MKQRCLQKNKSTGSSLIEAMLATALVAGVATTIFPIVFQSKKVTMHSDFYDQCISAVRTKMNEYRFGQNVDLNAVNATLTTGTVGFGGTSAGGFALAKARYNTERAYCPNGGAPNFTPTTVPQLPPAAANIPDLGREECIVGTGGGAPSPAACAAASNIDQNMQNFAPNFRVFVNLRRYNPAMNQEDCLWWGAAAPNHYDFQRLGDMIKVTVTGMIDLPAGRSFAGIDAASPRRGELTCQISDYIKPVTNTARYWMSTDGRFFRWESLNPGPNQPNLEILRNFASPGNLGFVVSPDNTMVFILRPGTIIQLQGCTDDPLDCPVAGQTTWTFNGNISSIGAIWGPVGVPHMPHPTCVAPTAAMPTLFGLLAGKQVVICINLPAGGGVVPLANMVYDDTVTGPPAAMRIPFQMPQTNRVHSFFMSPNGDNTMFVDTSCSTQLGNQVYCGGIYDSNDREMRYPIEVFNVKAVAFSK